MTKFNYMAYWQEQQTKLLDKPEPQKVLKQPKNRVKRCAVFARKGVQLVGSP